MRQHQQTGRICRKFRIEIVINIHPGRWNIGRGKGVAKPFHQQSALIVEKGNVEIRQDMMLYIQILAQHA